MSETFGQIEQELQSQFGAARLVVTEAIDITGNLSQREAASKFATFCRSTSPPNVVTIFVTTAHVSSQVHQSLKEIYDDALHVDPHRGLRFTVGEVDCNPNSPMIELIRVRVALGSPGNYQYMAASRAREISYRDEKPHAGHLRPCNHSLRLTSDGEYIVFSATQVFATHLVRLAGGENLWPAKEIEHMCDLCETAPATIWCLTESAKLCAECDEKSHAGNPIHERHERLDIMEARARMEVCPEHSDRHLKFYCPTCHIAMCEECKMRGNHSKGKTATHRLMSVEDAFKRAVDITSYEDRVIKARREILKKKIARADAELQAVVDNLEEVEAELVRQRDIALARARVLAAKKMLAGQSLQTELLRKQAEIDRFACFLQKHKRGSGPRALCVAAHRQGILAGEFQGVGDLPSDEVIAAVQGDLVVCDAVEVKLGDDLAGLTGIDVGASSTYEGLTYSPPVSKRPKSDMEIQVDLDPVEVQPPEAPIPRQSEPPKPLAAPVDAPVVAPVIARDLIGQGLAPGSPAPVAKAAPPTPPSPTPGAAPNAESSCCLLL
jgi:hypothetical protein